MKLIPVELTNEQIYNYALQIQKQFHGNESLTLPALINFYIQYNFAEFMKIAKIVEELQFNIGKTYGVLYETETESYYKIPAEKLEQANNELNQLLQDKHVINIYKIPLSQLQNINLTTLQMQALICMIDNDIE